MIKNIANECRPVPRKGQTHEFNLPGLGKNCPKDKTNMHDQQTQRDETGRAYGGIFSVTSSAPWTGQNVCIFMFLM